MAATQALIKSPHAVLSALNDLESAPLPASIRLKRVFARHSIRGDAVLTGLDDHAMEPETVRVQLRDIGLGGLGFLSPQPLAKHTFWRIAFSVRGYPFGHQVVRICHQRQAVDGLFLTGGQFCIDPALLCLLGVDPSLLVMVMAEQKREAEDAASSQFLSPDDVRG